MEGAWSMTEMVNIDDRGNQLLCPVCDMQMSRIGTASYYMLTSKLQTPVWECRACDIFFRDVDMEVLQSHRLAASYVNEKNEDTFLKQRVHFFEYILSLVKQRGGKSIDLLDFGSAYGHLISLALDQGLSAEGVEINKNLANKCRLKGQTIHTDIKGISKKFDVVTAIDSLYYVQNCREFMETMSSILKPDGIFIARITNRNHFIRFINFFRKRKDFSGIGDAIISLSLKGINAILKTQGYHLVKVIPDYGRGKKILFRKKLMYVISYLLTIVFLKKVVLTPGIIIIASPDDNIER